MLGAREPAVYGATTLSDVETLCHARAAELGAELDFRQTNHEGELVEWIQSTRTGYAHAADGMILNAGAYTHTSVAIRDAISASETPCIEVHLSNIHAREAFRHTSYVSDVAVGVIVGLGPQGYLCALDAFAARLRPTN